MFFCDRRGQFFVWSQTVRRQAEAEKGAEQLVSRTTAETQAVAGTIRTAVEKQRAISSSVQPGMPVGTARNQRTIKKWYTLHLMMALLKIQKKYWISLNSMMRKLRFL